MQCLCLSPRAYTLSPSPCGREGLETAAITCLDTQPIVNCLPRLVGWICSWGFRPQNSPPSHGRQLLAADKSAPGPGHPPCPPGQATPKSLCTAEA